MVAAAGALIISGPFVAVAASGGSDEGGGGSGTNRTLSANSAKDAFDKSTEKIMATDPATQVTATVAMEEKLWGTGTTLELKNVKGEQKCSLIAVGKNGERETITSWSVPGEGYGIPEAKSDKAKQPLYVQGGAAFQPNEIDHFQVMTFDGELLVEIDA